MEKAGVMLSSDDDGESDAERLIGARRTSSAPKTSTKSGSRSSAISSTRSISTISIARSGN